MIQTTGSLRSAITAVRHETGVVIPVYLPAGPRSEQAYDLEDTVWGCLQQLSDPTSLCLSVDGTQFGADAAARLRRRFGLSTVVGQQNRGKLHAVRQGMTHLIERHDHRFLAVVDADGDHFANELVNFVRAADHAESKNGNGVLVLGRRISRHHPLGFSRGELEELADRVLMDALQYHSAVTGKPLRLELLTLLDDVPDFHSGYKLFTRRTAETVFAAEPRPADVSEDCYFRHAVEAVMVVEALLSGAILCAVNRTTRNEQPFSTFGLLPRQELVADQLIWPLKRLGVPPPFIRQWLNNHLPRLLLATLAPEGREELHEIRRLVLHGCGVSDDVEPLRPGFL